MVVGTNQSEGDLTHFELWLFLNNWFLKYALSTIAAGCMYLVLQNLVVKLVRAVQGSQRILRSEKAIKGKGSPFPN